jgi:hypothetical protein
MDQVRQRDLYETNGYLILPAFFSGSEISDMERIQRELWRQPRNANIVVDILSDDGRGKRMRLADAPAEFEFQKYKINDAYLESDDLRAILLSKKISGFSAAFWAAIH